jgi:hypothetical protein
MTLSAYSELIRHLPYLEQAFETKKETWIANNPGKRSHSNNDFIAFCEEKFKPDSPKANTLKLSRADLFTAAASDLNSAIFSIILWGYPRNMRGNVSFPSFSASTN